jgi:hypothetical protein
MSVDPLTIGMMIASTAVSAMGEMQKAKSQKAQLAYQAKVAQNNADIAEDNRMRAIQEANVAATDQDQSASAILGEMMAEGGASGLSLQSGSKASEVASAKKLAKRDRARLVHEGAVEAFRTASPIYSPQAVTLVGQVS